MEHNESLNVGKSLIFQCELKSMTICIIITNKQMRCDSSKFQLSIQAKFSKDTGQQNIKGDVTFLQNSYFVKSKTRFLDTNVLCMRANFCALKHGKMKSKYTKAENTEISSLRSGYSISCVPFLKVITKGHLRSRKSPTL